MEKIISGCFEAGVLNKSNKEDLINIQKLRYEYLLREFNPNLPIGGIDDDGYDDTSDLLYVKDTTKNIFVGTYRLTTPLTNPNHEKNYIAENEYDLTELLDSKELFVNLSRACVHADYRDGGVVIKLLFACIFEYGKEINAKYYLGLCSFHGTDPTIYKRGFTYLYQNKCFTKYNLPSIMNPFKLNMLPNEIIDRSIEREELPGLLRMYLRFGHKVCPEGAIDKDFNDIDVLIILDRDDMSQRYIDVALRR